MGAFGFSAGPICLFFFGKQVHGPSDPLHPGAHTLPISGRTLDVAAGAGGVEATAVGGPRPPFETARCAQ